MAITTVDDIAAGLGADQCRMILKNISIPKAIGAFQSSWLAAGFPGTGATSPVYTTGSGYTCDKSTAGAILYSNGLVKNWLAKLFMSSSVAGTIILLDRLWSCSGMGYANSTYTVTTPGSLPGRITDNGVGCEIWCEQFVGAGAASGTLTVNYKNPAAGNEAGVIAAVISGPVIGQMQPVPLQAGSTGVSSIVSAVNSATWTSGSFGITIAKRIAHIEIPFPGAGRTLDWAALGLPVLTNDMCLQLVFLAAAATAPTIHGEIRIIDK